jgi:hypothetical protein
MVDKKKSSNRRSGDDVSYFASSRRKKKKYMMIIVPIVAAVIAIAVISAVMYSTQQSGNNNNNYGPVGSEHVHAAFVVKLDGTPIDFSQPKYQVQSQLIHVENNDGTTLHRHATNVPFGEFLRSVNMDINKSGCFKSDDGNQYCNNGDKRLRTFVNGNEMNPSSIRDYVTSSNDNDRILVIYGNENDAQIKQELNALEQIPIQRL